MKVLFIGNSHTFVHYVPARFQRFCSERGTPTTAGMLTHPNAGLDWHLNQSQTWRSEAATTAAPRDRGRRRCGGRVPGGPE